MQFLQELTLPQLFDIINSQFLGQHLDLQGAKFSMPMLTKVHNLFNKDTSAIAKLPSMHDQMLVRLSYPTSLFHIQ
jgi:hypothetical protein